MERTVGIGEWLVSTDPEDVLVTYSLGSCVGLALHDRAAGVAGLLHAMLPTASADRTRAEKRPAMYVDKGASDLLQAMFDLGAKRRHLVAKLAGAASCVQGEHIFRIGERNHTMVRRVLWKNDILIAAEDVGGSRSRTVYLEVGTGEVLVKTGGRTRPLDWTREVFR